MPLRNKNVLNLFLILAVMAIGATAATAQEQAPKVDIFGGYAWTHVGDRVGPFPLKDIPVGWGGAATYNFNNWAGFEIDAGAHYGDHVRVGTVTIGPRFKWHTEQVSPFVHTGIGVHKLSPSGFGEDYGIGVVAGGGLDIRLHERVDLRLIQADYVWAHHNFFPLTAENTNNSGARLRSGFVFKFGGGPPPAPPTASCAAEPREVMAGEPVKVTVTPSGFNPKRTLTYSWQSTGGKAEGTAQTTTVSTEGLAPGDYTVSGRVTDNKNISADCSAQFSIKQPPPPPPPTISCSANPATVRSGDPSTITCNAVSPDNHPLTFQWNATGGKLAPSNNTATLDTTGAAAGPITITTTVADDRNLTASATSSVNVEVPPPPPTSSKINEIAFTKPNNARVDNAAKAVLDDVALRLQREPDSKAVIVGCAAAEERRGDQLAATRARNAKAYLVRGEAQTQIDPTRIELRSKQGCGQIAEIWIVPAGATFDQPDTTVVSDQEPAKGRRR